MRDYFEFGTVVSIEDTNGSHDEEEKEAKRQLLTCPISILGRHRYLRVETAKHLHLTGFDNTQEGARVFDKMMLSPLSLHASLEALTAPLPSSTSQTAMRADLAALVLTDDGSLYASSSSSASTSAAPAQTLKQQQQQQQPAASGPLSGLEQQYVRKPGLRGLLGFGKPGLRAPAPVPVTAPASTKAGDEGPRAMDLDLRPDERVRVLCALARQAWLEEVARVHRLRSENENGDDIVGDDDDEEEEQERVDLDVAVPGTMLANGVAPLMVESEVGVVWLLLLLASRSKDSG